MTPELRSRINRLRSAGNFRSVETITEVFWRTMAGLERLADISPGAMELLESSVFHLEALDAYNPPVANAWENF